MPSSGTVTGTLLVTDTVERAASVSGYCPFPFTLSALKPGEGISYGMPLGL